MSGLHVPRLLFLLIGLFAAALGYARLGAPVLLAVPMSEQQVKTTLIGGDFRLLWAQGHLAAKGQADHVYSAAAIAAQEPVAAMGDRVKVRPSFYPPSSVFMLVPLGQLDFATAWWVFSWGSLLALVLVLCLLYRRQPELIAFGLGFAGVWTALSFGQATVLLTVLYLVFMWGSGRHPLPAGGAVGLAFFKPHLGVLAPLVLLLRRQYLLFICALLSVLALGFASYAVLGQASWLAYHQSVFAPIQRLETFDRISSHQLVSAFAIVRALGVPTQLALALHGLLALLALVALVMVCRRAVNPQLPVAALVLASLLVTPHAYTYDLVLLLVPVLALVRRSQRDGWQPADLVMVALLYGAPLVHTLLQKQVGFSPLPLILLAALALLVRHAKRDDHHAAH